MKSKISKKGEKIMSENLKKFLDLLGSDKELEAKALACNELGEEKGREAMLALAKECGIELTAADLEKQEEAPENSEATEEAPAEPQEAEVTL